MAVIVLNNASGGLLPTSTPSKLPGGSGFSATSYKPPAVSVTSTSGAWSCRNNINYNHRSSCIQTSSTDDKSSTWSSSLATSSSSSSKPLPYYHPNDPRRKGSASITTTMTRKKKLQRQCYDRDAEKKLYGGPSFSVPSPPPASLPLPSFGPSFSVPPPPPPASLPLPSFGPSFSVPPPPPPASLPLPSLLSTALHTPQQQQQQASTTPTTTTSTTKKAEEGGCRRQYSLELLLSLSQSAPATCPVDEPAALRDLVD